MDRTHLIDQLKALGETNRLTVAVHLADREWGAGELLERLGMSQPSLSRHLKVLREAGVVRERRAGRNAYYRLADGELPRLVAELAAAAQAPGHAAAGESASPGGRNMRDDESVSPGPGDEPEDDQPRSGSIEEWLL